MANENIDWDQLMRSAQNATDNQFSNRISALTHLTEPEIETAVMESGISNKDLVEVFRLVRSATLSNEDKAAAVSKINKGVNLLIKLTEKLL